MATLALFDFDGTLTRKDTLLEFIKYSHGSFRFYLGFLILSPLLILFKLGLLGNSEVKQIVLRLYFRGTSIIKFQELCTAFVMHRIPKFIRREAIERLNYHKSQGDDIYIVSASPENWVRLYSESLSVHCIATKLVVNEGRITGKIEGKNCYGIEKVKRIKAQLDVDKFSSIFAYGDSRGDHEMMLLAKHSYYKKFS
jgi:phosphatidylglycerophosphatase C